MDRHVESNSEEDVVCISFIRTLGTHNNQIIVTSRNTHALDQCGYFINSEIA